MAFHAHHAETDGSWVGALLGWWEEGLGLWTGAGGFLKAEATFKWLYEAEGMSSSWWAEPGVQVAFDREKGRSWALFVAVMYPVSVTSWLVAPRARSSPAEPRPGCRAAGVNPAAPAPPPRPPSLLPPAAEEFPKPPPPKKVEI